MLTEHLKTSRKECKHWRLQSLTQQSCISGTHKHVVNLLAFCVTMHRSTEGVSFLFGPMENKFDFHPGNIILYKYT